MCHVVKVLRGMENSNHMNISHKRGDTVRQVAKLALGALRSLVCVKSDEQRTRWHSVMLQTLGTAMCTRHRAPEKLTLEGGGALEPLFQTAPPSVGATKSQLPLKLSGVEIFGAAAFGAA